ncbi:hypothetical protein RJ55_02601 [Drechmeria coniospora]|nr:hypothetical protein RJ55_02601 [Drechmeria coniospora]
MAASLRLVVTITAILLSNIVSAVRVTSGSPCAGALARCLTCLETSGYAQGDDSDQKAFLYNLRYTLSYCVFGLPNATAQVASNPCITSEACGRLSRALGSGITAPVKENDYAYCDVDSGVVRGPYLESCRQCLRAGGNRNYLSNFLIALDAGCRQMPSGGLVIGLSSSVFANSTVEITQPTAPAPAGQRPSSDGPPLSVGAIIGIVFGSLAFVLLLAACVLVFLRKCKSCAAKRSGLSVRLRRILLGPDRRGDGTVAVQSTERAGQVCHERCIVDEKSPYLGHDDGCPFATPQSVAAYWPPPPTPTSNQRGEGVKPAAIVTTVPAYAAPLVPVTTPAPCNSPDGNTPPLSTISTTSHAPLLKSPRHQP